MATFFVLSLLALFGAVEAGGLYNVKSYSKGSGDYTSAFVAAFQAACAASPATVYVPAGTYMVQPFAVAKCNDITLQVEGTITAPAKKGQWKSWKGLGKGKGWIQFDWMKNLLIVSKSGQGTFDGKASLSNWWNQGRGPISLSFTHCENLILRGFKVINSPGTHIQVDLQMIEGQKCVLAELLTIDSHDDSPNTDGIHISHCWNAIIRNNKIGCGDDCVVMQTDCKNVLVENIHCGPGNGISLGSLGNGVDSCMNNILVQKCTFVNTENGVRLKAWPNKGGGAATGITFRDITMVNVKLPIIISQCYSGGSSKICNGGGKSVAMYDIVFDNIVGTCYKNSRCITMTCFGGSACVGVTMRNIKLQGTLGTCNGAYGNEWNVQPRGCLQPGEQRSHLID
eukprot:TRINITY_DN14818_c0_g1_i3.p1 TRINITY_DN14818_c0_g1~~TRINITY_DN14818_c0_g1_i3.p1  ORF type:complete len:461 (-),score=71.39 TRINITY_DN14818_c0_g1_i3:62-1252(-)